MRRSFLLIATLSCLGVGLAPATPSQAASLSFDEVPATNANFPALSEEYAEQGVHFYSADDGAVWSGLSQGDPGQWGLEGTNGSAFLGFNGQSYAMEAWFDHPVSGVSVDVARTSVSNVGDSFTLLGYFDGALVEEVTAVHGAVAEWQTVALSETVDALEWFGEGRVIKFGDRIVYRYPLAYGLDNLQWAEDEASLVVPVDVKPGSLVNPINLVARGVVSVALMGSEVMDVHDADASSVYFGPGGASLHGHASYEDVDLDGTLDMIMHFSIQDSGLVVGDMTACLSGMTLEGRPFQGCDEVRTWKPRPAAAKKTAR